MLSLNILCTDEKGAVMVTIIMARRGGTVPRGHVTWLLFIVAGIAVLCPGCISAFLQSPREYLLSKYLVTNADSVGRRE